MRTVAIALLVVGACRERTPAPAPSKDPAPAATHAAFGAPAPTPAGPRPTLPDVPLDAAASPPSSVAGEFDAEPIDRFWRTNTEATIRRHMANLSELECHKTLCQITATGSEAEVERAFDGMRGVTDSLLFTAPDIRPDGTVALRAYARFTRGE